jgi:molybdopterin synthase catalytic subunit
MRRELTISEQKIDEHALLKARVTSDAMGAAVYFLGIVRGQEEGHPISALGYEAFGPMAERQFHLLFDQAETRWSLESVRLVHRIGRVEAAPHREEAFAACQFIISKMKRVVPIWKKAFPLA